MPRLHPCHRCPPPTEAGDLSRGGAVAGGRRPKGDETDSSKEGFTKAVPWLDAVAGKSLACALLASLAALPLTGQAPTPDHGVWDQLLGAHVGPRGLVDYDAFAEADAFPAYLESLASAALEPLPEAERLALWINAYNAYTIALINAHGERESIRNINKRLGIFGKGPWNEEIAHVAGETYTLDEIEHEIIRERFEEPRIHFALVCAAMGCPPLRSEAYDGARLDAQLDAQARRFLLESPGKNRVDPDAGVVRLSRIFDWYREDFPSGRDGLGRYLADFFPPGRERSLLESGAFDLEFTDYDWSLNAR